MAVLSEQADQTAPAATRCSRESYTAAACLSCAHKFLKVLPAWPKKTRRSQVLVIATIASAIVAITNLLGVLAGYGSCSANFRYRQPFWEGVTSVICEHVHKLRATVTKDARMTLLHTTRHHRHGKTAPYLPAVPSRRIGARNLRDAAAARAPPPA